MLDFSPTPPTAVKRPKTLSNHGVDRVDPYFWMNQREDEQVTAYLNAENDYTKAVMKPTLALQETLFEEIKGRIKQNDESVPYRVDGYYYYARFIEGAEYPIHCRKKGSLDAEEEILADGNEMAKDHSYFSLRTQISPNHQILAEITDTVGRRIYDVRFKDLNTGKYLTEEISQTTGNIAWANDNQTLFYSQHDAQTLRPYQIYRMQLGSPDRTLVYQEDDETYTTHVYRTKSRKFLMIMNGSTVATEYRYLSADTPTERFELLEARERDHEYYVDHFGDEFFIRTNQEKSPNFKLMKVRVSDPQRANWQELIPHRKDVLLEDLELFENYLVLAERKEGLVKLRIRHWASGQEHYLAFSEPSYVAGFSVNPDFYTDLLRYNYQSLTTPSSTYDYDMSQQESVLLKQQEVLGGFVAAHYKTERHYATATDGTQVPISLVYRPDQFQEGQNPCLIYAYGSYGITMEAHFRTSILSLLDRGFVYAIAHIRGGQEMGRHWYDDGKLLNKKNTFTDYLDCTEYLIKHGFAHPDKVFAMGGSAGGLLMGAVMNARPELYKAVVAAVPFVDVVTTMLDDSIPLTTGEYDEWGNPNDKEYFEYMLSYSPYDQVKAQGYPHLLITSGLHDSQVQYWEPTKWAARLRELKTDKRVVLLHTNMDAGHGGASGRFEQFKEIAMEYAFILSLT